MRDERAAPLFGYLVRQMDRRKFAASSTSRPIEALGIVRRRRTPSRR